MSFRGALKARTRNPDASNQRGGAGDPAALTLAEIVTALRAGEGRRPGLLPVPPALIALAAKALGRAEEWQRMGGELVVDPGKLMQAGWRPAVETRASLGELARENASEK